MKKIIVLCLVALLGVGMAVAQGPKKGGKSVTTTVFMTNLDCQGCAKKITDTIPYEKGVKDVQVDVDTKTVTVTFDPAKTNNETLVKAFAKVKIEAAPMADKCAGECCGHHHDAKPEAKQCTDGCCDDKQADKQKKCDDGCCDGHDHGHAHNHAK
jgi:copper chaperone CopZ